MSQYFGQPKDGLVPRPRTKAVIVRAGGPGQQHRGGGPCRSGKGLLLRSWGKAKCVVLGAPPGHGLRWALEGFSGCSNRQKAKQRAWLGWEATDAPGPAGASGGRRRGGLGRKLRHRAAGEHRARARRSSFAGSRRAIHGQEHPKSCPQPPHPTPGSEAHQA